MFVACQYFARGMVPRALPRSSSVAPSGSVSKPFAINDWTIADLACGFAGIPTAEYSSSSHCLIVRPFWPGNIASRETWAGSAMKPIDHECMKPSR